VKILFICTHNRCRSILAEALANHLGSATLEARSAGSQPAGEVHPRTLAHLDKRGVPTSGLRSKSWDELEHFQPDVVITVCDRAAGESCPLWFDDSIRLHWGLADPSAVEGSEADIESAFDNCTATLTRNIQALDQVSTLPETRWRQAIADRQLDRH
jgi:arsenate reductase